jgi:asparagine synthase (glutamine-hydrolysing)
VGRRRDHPVPADPPRAPGSIVTVELTTLALSQSAWFRPSEVVDPDRMEELARRGHTRLTAELEDVLRASARRRLMADVPIGTMCYGGVDSSLITAFAADEQPAIRAYTASIADQPDADEAQWARKVAATVGVELRTIRVTAESWRRDLVAVVRHNEYPMRHESSVPMAKIAETARSDGVKVLLSGEGADKLFGGYDGRHQSSYEALVPREQLRRDLRRTAAARAREVWLRRGRGASGSMVSIVRRRPSAVLSRLSDDPRGAAESGLLESCCRLAYAHHQGAHAALEAALLGDLSTFLPHLLNRQDKATMQHSIETRVPFLDPEVVALALNLPLEARVMPVRKGILRDLARRQLPHGVAGRYKFGFGFDVRRYIGDAANPCFLEDGHLRQVFAIPAEAWRRAVRGLHRRHVLRFWTGEIWCRLFLDGRSVGTIESELWR